MSKGFRREMSERNSGPGKLRQMTSVVACDPPQSRPQGQDWATGWGPAPGGHCGQFSEQSFIVRNQLCGGFDFPPRMFTRVCRGCGRLPRAEAPAESRGMQRTGRGPGGAAAGDIQQERMPEAAGFSRGRRRRHIERGRSA